MNCKDTRKWMSPYLDSELGPTKTFEVSEHLRTCPKCKGRFEVERQADETIRFALTRDVMPPELWSRIRYELSTPPWVRRLRSTSGLAVAACLALVLVTGAFLWQGAAEPDQPWIVRQYRAETSSNGSFVAGEAERVGIEKLLRDTLGVRLHFTSVAEALGHHDLEMISAERRTDDHGRTYVELRVNCCHRPVLVALARPTDGEWPAMLEGLSVNNENTATRVGDVNLFAADLGGVIAVAASRHPVSHILESLQLQEV